MATHSSTLAWKVPWTEEPGGLQSMGSWRVGHDWATSLSLFTFMHWRRQWQPTPVFLPGESQGQGSLVGCCPWGHTESDTTEVTWQQQQQHSLNFLFLDYQRGWTSCHVFISYFSFLSVMFKLLFLFAIFLLNSFPYWFLRVFTYWKSNLLSFVSQTSFLNLGLSTFFFINRGC